jgi:predicted nucleotidyltransferase
MERQSVIDFHEQQLHEFCHRWKVTEFALFGSILNEDFNPESDIDILVTFSPETHWSLFDLVTMQNELETILGNEVDLVERSALERSANYIRRKSILDSMEIIYAAG